MGIAVIHGNLAPFSHSIYDFLLRSFRPAQDVPVYKILTGMDEHLPSADRVPGNSAGARIF